MSRASPPVRDVADTALWVAHFRARETARADALFRDPYAARLAGARGAAIAEAMPEREGYDWAWAARTRLFDLCLARAIEGGADTVLNLAAGLDARPYRLDLPAGLRWVEVDLPAIIAHKEAVLADAEPRCELRRVALDLADVAARRALFAELNGRARHLAVITEGLLIYLERAEVAALADDLSACPRAQSWSLDLNSPGLLQMMEPSSGGALRAAGAAFRFAPPEGPAFFEPHGWRASEVRGLFKTAASLGRVPFAGDPSSLPDGPGPTPDAPWSGVCFLQRR